MQRGEQRGLQIAVLFILGVVGVLAIASIVSNSATGRIAQGEQIFPAASVDLGCQQGPALYAGTVGIYDQWCCPEDIVGDTPQACVAIRHIPR